MTRVSEASSEAVLFQLYREQHDCEVVAQFRIMGEPVSKARARFTKRGSKVHAYTPERTKTGEEMVAWRFKQAAPGHQPDSEWTYGVFAVFFNGTRQRRDVDNMLKLILDGLNKVAWADDSQVDEVSGRRGVDIATNARTEVLIYKVGAVRKPPQGNCAHCDQRFDMYNSWKQMKKFCSPECRVEARRIARVRICAHCENEFSNTHLENPPKYCSTVCKSAAGRRDVECNHCGTTFSKQACHVRKQNYCTTECRDTSARLRRTKDAKASCQTCDGFVSKKTYMQCRACRMKGLPVPGKPILPVTPITGEKP